MADVARRVAGYKADGDRRKAADGRQETGGSLEERSDSHEQKDSGVAFRGLDQLRLSALVPVAPFVGFVPMAEQQEQQPQPQQPKLHLDKRIENQWLNAEEAHLRVRSWEKRHQRWEMLKSYMEPQFMWRLAARFEPNDLIHGTKVVAERPPRKRQCTLTEMWKR